MKDIKINKKVAHWWPILQGFHAIAFLCASRYRVPSQYLCESWSAVPLLPSSLVVTLDGTT